MSEERTIKKYTFNYFTGYGYREIAPHTIRTYPVCVKATSFREAVVKLEKKLLNLSRYNNCFDSQGEVQVIEEYGKNSKVGLFWIGDKVVKWEGETCYYKPQCFGKAQMQSFNLPTVEAYYGSWIGDHCCGRITYSYVGWIKYSMNRFDYTKWYSTDSRESQIRDYKRYIVDEIEYLIKSNHCPEEDKLELKSLKLLE